MGSFCSTVTVFPDPTQTPTDTLSITFCNQYVQSRYRPSLPSLLASAMFHSDKNTANSVPRDARGGGRVQVWV